MYFTGDGADAFSTVETQQSIAANDSWTVPITFLPESYLTYEALLVIESNDEDNPVAEVSLGGTVFTRPFQPLR